MSGLEAVVVLPAAGTGSRLGATIPKQVRAFYTLGEGCLAVNNFVFTRGWRGKILVRYAEIFQNRRKNSTKKSNEIMGTEK